MQTMAHGEPSAALPPETAAAVAEADALGDQLLAAGNVVGNYIKALAARLAGDSSRSAQILRDLVRAHPDARPARVLLMFELAGQAGTVDDLAELGALVSSDFLAEEVFFPLLRGALVAWHTGARTVNVDIGGAPLAWPLYNHKQSYVMTYHWVPTYHNSAASVGEFYENYERYAAAQEGRTARLAADLSRWVRFAPGDRVLDAGCGSGDLLAAVGALVPIVPFGVDLSAPAADVARVLVPGIDFRVAPLDAIPHPDNSFDVVLCTDVLEHIPQPGPVVAELCRVVRPGGVVAISVPDGRYDSYPGHVNFFSTQSLEVLLAPHGAVEFDIHADGIFAAIRP